MSNLVAFIRRRTDAVYAEMVSEMDAIGREWVTKQQKVVFIWKHRPKFIHQLTARSDLIRVTSKPTGDNAKIYKWVDKGTKKHIIRPKKAGGVLRFRTGYFARTQPIAKANVGPGIAVGGWRSAKEVHHPGTKARKFTRKFFEQTESGFKKRITLAIRRGIARS